MDALQMLARGAQYEDLAEQWWPREEIIDGCLFVTPPENLLHQTVVGNLMAELRRVAPARLKPFLPMAILRRSKTDRLLIPDGVVVTRQAVSQRREYFDPRDVFLAVEVMSSYTRVPDLHLKPPLYDEWGVESFWVLDTEHRLLHEFGTRRRTSCWLNNVQVGNFWLE